MKFTKKHKLILSMLMFNLILILSFMMVNVQDSQAHELAHAAIAKNYGCVNHSISIKLNGNGEFLCHEYTGDYDRDIEKQLHSINEIVSYNLFTLVSVIEFGFLLLMNTAFFIFYNNKYP